MIQARVVCAALLALVLAAAPAPAQAADPPFAPGKMIERTFANPAGSRTYRLYVATTGAAGKPLMIWLHGCAGPLTMQAGHALARVAEERGFALAYPVQPAAANPARCWNFFQKGHMHRGTGEPSIIAGITRSLVAELGSDPARVYVGGYSAGGAMTSVMGAAYPDLYAAIAPSSGAPYGLDPSGREAYAEMSPRARPLPAFILQGVLDEISLYPIGRTNLLQWLGTDDYADDGTANRSVARRPSSIEPKLVPTAVPLPLTIEHYTKGSCELAQFLTSPHEHLINGVLLSEDAGLELQRMMMTFLLAHRLGDACRGPVAAAG